MPIKIKATNEITTVLSNITTVLSNTTSPQPNTTTEEPWWTTINDSDVYYYDGNPRGTRPYLNVIPYKSFLRDRDLFLVCIPVFAAVTGIIVLVCIATRMKRCCFGLFETYRIRPMRRCLVARWINNLFGRISPCFGKKKDQLYCACHGGRECIEYKFGYQKEKTIEFLTTDEIRETFNVCKCDERIEPTPEMKRSFVARDRNVRFNTEVTVVNPPMNDDYNDIALTSDSTFVPESSATSSTDSV